jgi:hypothetical protein
MENQKKILKEDINFLEYPNWVIDSKSKVTTLRLEKAHGVYEILSPLGIPKHFDKTVIYFLLYKLYQEQDMHKYVLNTSRYEIAKSIFGGNHFGKNIYDRIMQSLKKWKALSINFEGVFYEDDGYTIRCFSIIDEVVFRKETGKILIRFNEAYARQLKETKFYKLIDFEHYKRLQKPASARLYEILSKNFKERDVWTINIQILGEKLTFDKRKNAQKYYPSEILRYLIPSVKEINNKTVLKIEFSYQKENSCCIFSKVKPEEKKYKPATKAKAIKDNIESEHQILTQDKACYDYFLTLSEEEQFKILKGIEKEPYMKFIPDEVVRIQAYMLKKKLWIKAE